VAVDLSSSIRRYATCTYSTQAQQLYPPQVSGVTHCSSPYCARGCVGWRWEGGSSTPPALSTRMRTRQSWPPLVGVLGPPAVCSTLPTAPSPLLYSTWKLSVVYTRPICGVTWLDRKPWRGVLWPSAHGMVTAVGDDPTVTIEERAGALPELKRLPGLRQWRVLLPADTESAEVTASP
jgi:hypothetical protein